MLGTFLVALFSGFVLRSLLASATRRLCAILGAEITGGHVRGLTLGDYELHVVKTAHLGLCQVMCMKTYLRRTLLTSAQTLR